MIDQKKLKKLKRSDLFALLVEQAQKIERLQEKTEILEQKLKERDLKIEKAGSIAEASLALTQVFEVAQDAADLYLQNVKRLAKTDELDVR